MILATRILARHILLLAVTTSFSAEHPPKAPVPSSPYIGVVYRYADAMLDGGRDNFGPASSGLFLSALDRKTPGPLTHLPTAPAGVDLSQRSGTHGANPQHNENLLRLLYTLNGLSGNAKYSAAADQELKWFMEHTAAPSTGLLPWGVRMAWDTLHDQAHPEKSGVHEFFRPWLLWDRCFELAPNESARFARALWNRHITDHTTGAFTPQAGFNENESQGGAELPRHAGFYIRTWAAAYAHTRNQEFLQAIETTIRRHETNQPPGTGSAMASSDPAQILSFAIDCAGAATSLPHSLSEKLRELTAREDNLFCALNHDVPSHAGFLSSAEGTGSGKTHTPLWRAGRGSVTTAQMAMMCAARYYNGGDVRYRDLILQAARAYLESEPPVEEDVWAMTLGHVISLQLAAWRCAADSIYLERARHFGDLALREFWEDSPLPRASSKTLHYEALTGPDTLALALVEMHLEILAITAVRIPVNTIDR